MIIPMQLKCKSDFCENDATFWIYLRIRSGTIIKDYEFISADVPICEDCSKRDWSTLLYVTMTPIERN